MKEYDLYLFDFDGTLVDTYESLTYVFSGAYKAVGVEIGKDDVARLMRTTLEEGYKSCHGPEDEESQKLYGKMIVKLLDDEHTLRLSKTYSEVKSTLNELIKRGKRLGIVTSNSKKHVIDVLGYIGLEKEMFAVIIGNAETPKRKPNPEPVLTALDILGVSKDKACYVGDAMDDMTCGQRAGVGVILVDRYQEYKDSPLTKIETIDKLL